MIVQESGFISVGTQTQAEHLEENSITQIHASREEVSKRLPNAEIVNECSLTVITVHVHSHIYNYIITTRCIDGLKPSAGIKGPR